MTITTDSTRTCGRIDPGERSAPVPTSRQPTAGTKRRSCVLSHPIPASSVRGDAVLRGNPLRRRPGTRLGGPLPPQVPGTAPRDHGTQRERHCERADDPGTVPAPFLALTTPGTRCSQHSACRGTSARCPGDVHDGSVDEGDGSARRCDREHSLRRRSTPHCRTPRSPRRCSSRWRRSRRMSRTSSPSSAWTPAPSWRAGSPATSARLRRPAGSGRRAE